MHGELFVHNKIFHFFFNVLVTFFWYCLDITKFQDNIQSFEFKNIFWHNFYVSKIKGHKVSFVDFAFKLGRSINVKTIPLHEFWEYYFFSLLYSWKKVIQFLIVLSKMAPVFYMFTQKNTEIQSSRMLTFWKVTPQDDHFNLYNLLRPT